MTTPRSNSPIVLVHGIFGFSRLGIAGVSVEYFRRIPAALRAAGRIVPDPPSLRTAGSIVERAEDLKTYMETAPGVAGQRVHLIAHSLEGLDARWMISKLNMAERVLSLTTIGTPHQGTPIADLVGTLPGLDAVMEHAGIDIKGLADLTTSASVSFNRTVLDVPNVHYFAVAGKFAPPRFLGHPLGILGPSHDVVRDKDGANDGLVSTRSALFRERGEGWTVLGQWPENHFRLINWGTNILPTASEALDDSVVDRYKAVAFKVGEVAGG